MLDEDRVYCVTGWIPPTRRQSFNDAIRVVWVGAGPTQTQAEWDDLIRQGQWESLTLWTYNALGLPHYCLQWSANGLAVALATLHVDDTDCAESELARAAWLGLEEEVRQWDAQRSVEMLDKIL